MKNWPENAWEEQNGIVVGFVQLFFTHGFRGGCGYDFISHWSINPSDSWILLCQYSQPAIKKHLCLNAKEWKWTVFPWFSPLVIAASTASTTKKQLFLFYQQYKHQEVGYYSVVPHYGTLWFLWPLETKGAGSLSRARIPVTCRMNTQRNSLTLLAVLTLMQITADAYQADLVALD